MASRKRWWWRQRRAKTGHRVVFTRGVYSGVLTDRHGAPGVVAGVAVRGCHGLMGEKWFGCEGSWLLRGVTHIPLRGIVVDVSRVIGHWCSTNPLEVYVMRSPDVQDLGWSAAGGGVHAAPPLCLHRKLPCQRLLLGLLSLSIWYRA